MDIKDTAGFRTALDSDPFAAEHWLETVRKNRIQFPQYDDRWLDHRERELFREFCRREWWAGAKRVVDATADPRSRQGRKERLEELSHMPYDSIQ